MVTIREGFKPSDEQLARLKDRAIKEGKSEKEIYEAFVKKGWIDRDEEVEKSFEEETKEETPTTEESPDNESPINGIEEEESNDLTKETSVDNSEEKIDRSIDGTTLLKDANFASSFAKPVYEYLKNKFGGEAGKVMTQKILGKFANGWIKSLDGLEKFIKTPGALQTVLNTAISVYETNSDMKKGLTKNDAASTASDFVDNFLLNLPSFVTHATGHTPYWENETKGEQQAQVEQMNKDKETRNKYSDMGGGWFGNLLGTDKTEGGFLEEDKNIKNKFGGDASMYAEQQLSAYAASKGKLNDSKLKKDLIDKGYKFQTVKDKNTGEKYQTWVNKEGKTLLNKKQLEQTGKKDFRKEGDTINI